MPGDDLMGMFPCAGPCDGTGPQRLALAVLAPLAAGLAVPLWALAAAVWTWLTGDR